MSIEPTLVVQAVVGVVGTILGSAVTGPVVAHLLGRRHAATQTEHLKAQTDILRQDIYQQLTEDLRAELQRVQSELHTTQTLLRATSAEAERLRTRVLDLESRVAQLTQSEARASEALREVQAERDRLRADLAARDATIAELRQQLVDLRLREATLQAGTHPLAPQ